ncbi:MAG: shikimate kinase [Nannocystaceae bacterium]
MEGYYDHHPTAHLERPLAITGFCGAGVEAVAHSVSWRTGIPFFSSDRQLEHDLGTDLAVAHLTFADRLVELERAVIKRALARRPPPVIALGDASLVDAPTLERVTQAATLVYLTGDPAELLRRIHAARAQNPSRYLPTVPLDLDDPAALEPLIATREPGYRRAQHVLPIAGRHPHTLAAAILELLGVPV